MSPASVFMEEGSNSRACLLEVQALRISPRVPMGVSGEGAGSVFPCQCGVKADSEAAQRRKNEVSQEAAECQRIKTPRKD